MRREDVRVLILRIEGTNCEEESARAFRLAGASPEIVHLNQLLARDLSPGWRRRLGDYTILMLPGGFSAGDYVRAGAIFAARMRSGLEADLRAFVDSGRPILGICNGFQVLVELGLLPALHGTMAPAPEACLGTNDSNRYECRPTILRHDNHGRCVFTRHLPFGARIVAIAAHAEGKLLFPKGEETRILRQLEAEDQVVFRYVDPDGSLAGYPWCPSGTFDNIAALCNPAGNVFGMMPHPERVLTRYTHPDWTRGAPSEVGEGRTIFESVVDYCVRRF